MSTLTHLSDAELDEVTGGSFDFTRISVVKIASNVNITNQSQTNVGIGQFFTSTGGAQINQTSQVAIAH
jgi:hypothetical protein